MRNSTTAENFIPYIKDFEQEAEAFLRNYGMEDAIQTPERIPIEMIASKKMTLDLVESEHLSKEGSVQGATVFHDGIIDVYDPKEDEYVGFPVKAASILVDAGITNIGRRRNVIAHECFHWHKHRLFFVYKAKNEKAKEIAFRCDKSCIQGQATNDAWGPEEKMEWQANKIAPKILMPRIAFQKKADELLLSENNDGLILRSLAEFFGVSLQSAYIRMKELGYTLADQVAEEPVTYDFYDNSGNKKHDPLPLELNDIFEAYQRDDVLKGIVDTGQVRYVDGFLVLNDQSCIYEADGDSHIRADAKDSLEKYVVGFSVKYKKQYDDLHTEGLLYRSDGHYTKKVVPDHSPQNSHIYDEALQLERLKVTFEERYEKSRDMNITANERIAEHMERAKWNTAIFLDKTLLSEMDYSRVKQPDHRFKKETLMAMAVGLSLTKQEFEEILNKAGMALSPTDRTDQAYTFILEVLHGKDIYECNDFLEEVGLAPLGTQSRK